LLPLPHGVHLIVDLLLAARVAAHPYTPSVKNGIGILIPAVRNGDIPPDHLNSPAKRFVPWLDNLKILLDVLLSLLDSFKIRQEKLLSLPDNIKITRDHIKIQQDKLLSLLDNIKSSRDHIKIQQDILLSVPRNWILPLNNLHLRAVTIPNT